MKRYCQIMLLLAYGHVASGAEPAPPLYRASLPALLANQEVRMDEVTLLPGVEVPAHRHNAHVYVYVIEGSVDMQVEGREVQHLSAGQIFVETPEDVHTVMRNPSGTETARFVSVTISTAGESNFTIVSPASQ